VIIFDALTRECIHKIIEIELQQLYGRVEDLGYELKINDQAKDFIVEKGYDEKFGARPLKRAIQKYVEDPLAEEIIKTKLKEGDVISISLNKNGEELNIKVSKPKVKGKVSKNNGAPKAKNNLGKGASDKKTN
jgi:ATP-dependent Clp protease ATP-binding subunit ClpC